MASGGTGCRWWVTAGLLAAVLASSSAPAAPPVPELGGLAPLGAEVQHLHFKYGPIHVGPGHNLILIGPVTIEKPLYDGYVTRMKPGIVNADGTVPATDVVHLHHGVFLNLSRRDSTGGPGGERFFATGEEQTIFQLPTGYGYPVKATDVWALNYMVHNLTPVPQTVWITYDLDYVPAGSELGRQMRPVRPIWMDVRNGSAYPVFDVHRGAGVDGRFTYPEDASPSPYRAGHPLNQWTVDRSGTLVATAGHVHPGGLETDLYLERGGSTAHLFRSTAHYFDPAGPISWDLAMTATKPDWRVGVRRGDRLRVTATYDTTRASWYESMGIMVVYMANDHGPDPFTDPPDVEGAVTHGHLAANDNHGGQPSGAPDPASLPDGATLDNQVGIGGFTYLPGNLGSAGPFGDPPIVHRGHSLVFGNLDAASQIFHTITACRSPCTGSTGISYPLANGPIDFDSGDLGYGPTGFTAAANRAQWKTPAALPLGTYTYFCRIHPYMRGAFRVVR